MDARSLLCKLSSIRLFSSPHVGLSSYWLCSGFFANADLFCYSTNQPPPITQWTIDLWIAMHAFLYLTRIIIVLYRLPSVASAAAAWTCCLLHWRLLNASYPRLSQFNTIPWMHAYIHTYIYAAFIGTQRPWHASDLVFLLYQQKKSITLICSVCEVAIVQVCIWVQPPHTRDSQSYDYHINLRRNNQIISAGMRLIQFSSAQFIFSSVGSFGNATNLLFEPLCFCFWCFGHHLWHQAHPA